MAKIFVSIAAYRDPELLPTLKDLLVTAKNPKDSILVNLSGRGDKDIDYIIEHYPIPSK